MRVCEILDIDDRDYSYVLKFPVMGNPHLLVDARHCRVGGLISKWQEEDAHDKEEQ